MSTEDTLKLALDALIDGDWYIGQLENIVYSSDDNGMHAIRVKAQKAIKGLEEALAKQALIQRAEEAFEASQQEHGEQDTLAYREAASLAQWLFNKHFAHEEHYASGRVVWGLCDTTAGVISQIDNMVCKLVREQEQGEPVGYAGVKVWVGNQQVFRVLTQTEMNYAVTPWRILELACMSCISKLKDKNNA